MRHLLAATMTGSVLLCPPSPPLAAATPPITDPVVALLSTSEDALIMGGAGVPTPGAGYVNAATRLYLDPNGFIPTSGNGNVSALTTPETTLSNSYTVGEQDLIAAVNAAQPATTYAFGYSESADITAMAAPALQHDATRFVVVGDSANPNGGYLTMNGLLGLYSAVPTTPAQYGDIPTNIYTLGYDGWADYPQYVLNSYATQNAQAGETYEHLAYLGLTPQEIANAPTTTVGNVTYHEIPSALLPMLAGDLFEGRAGDELYDLNAPYDQVQVDLGYGHLDKIVNGQVVPNEFNTGSPATVVTANFGSPPIDQAAINQTLSEASTIGYNDYLQALANPSYEGPAYAAALAMEQYVAAGVATGEISSATGSTLDSTLMSGF